jgi:uncharacterized caspase-like protein
MGTSCRVLHLILFGSILLIGGEGVQAQPDPTKFNQNYQAALDKARQECSAMWSDHVFDLLRNKLPLGEQKPTMAMLTNSERVRPKDKRLASLAIKANEKCRQAYSPAFALLPLSANNLIDGFQRSQDALIAELYVGKITYGEFNIQMDRLNGDLSRVLSGISYSPPPQTPEPARPNLVAPAGKKTATPSVSQASSSKDTEKKETPVVASLKTTRIALVIGNSAYANLPQLSNPTNDARSIATMLQKIGFTATLVLDASDQTLRREIRTFSKESSNADVALVFYAGHGAQINGDNYILPVDIDIPRTETDIQLSALKVDDLVNSIRASTKIVFLDACRDNPALFKNMVAGRGAYPKGLAPANASAFEATKPGGGVFIAYATDSGSVAIDGTGQHSPFTQALLRNLDKPISIDDLFSLVTKEVRLTTKNTQRPYKYASLENIICLAGACPSSNKPAETDFIEQAKLSETEELQIALQTNTVNALDTYLRKYPNSTRRADIFDKVARLRMSEFNEWTLYEIGDQRFPHYLRLSSAEKLGNRGVVLTRFLADPSRPIMSGQEFPKDVDVYVEDLSVFDCSEPVLAAAERSVVTNSGEVIFHYKWADPQFLNLSIGMKLAPGSVGLIARTIVCHDEMRTPLIDKSDLTLSNFISLSSTVKGDGEMFYLPLTDEMKDGDNITPIVAIKLNKARTISEDAAQRGLTFNGQLDYRVQISKVEIYCPENKISFLKTEFYDDEQHLVLVSPSDLSKEVPRIDVSETSPYGLLRRIACNLNEASK